MEHLSKYYGSENRYYRDWLWFSSVNYTTTTEYFGELKILVKKMIESHDYCEEKERLTILYNALNDVLHK